MLRSSESRRTGSLRFKMKVWLSMFATATNQSRSRVLLTWSLCAVLVLFVGRTSAMLVGSVQTVSQTEHESRTITVEANELFHSESARRCTKVKRSDRYPASGESQDKPTVASTGRLPDHWHFCLTHQQNAHGGPLLC